MLKSADSVTLSHRSSVMAKPWILVTIADLCQPKFYMYTCNYVAPWTSWICLLFTRMHARVETKPFCLEIVQLIYMYFNVCVSSLYLKNVSTLCNEIFRLILVLFTIQSTLFCSSFIFFVSTWSLLKYTCTVFFCFQLPLKGMKEVCTTLHFKHWLEMWKFWGSHIWHCSWDLY